LGEADLIVAEDTRVAARLLTALEMRKAVVRVDEHTPASQISAILERASHGETVAVTTDAGTPGVSDPGAALVDRAYELKLPVDSVPGASAVSNALALSGFYAQRYSFLGFLPRKANSLKQEFEPYQASPMTLVFFESPHRIQKALLALFLVLGDRRVCVCREMTKLHQQVVRGRLSELQSLDFVSKGEYTVVVEGRRRKDGDG